MKSKELKIIDRSVCFECGGNADAEHHVVPKSLGGKKTIPLCNECHRIVHSCDSSISTSRLLKANGNNRFPLDKYLVYIEIDKKRGKASSRTVAKDYDMSFATILRIWNRKGIMYQEYQRFLDVAKTIK